MPVSLSHVPSSSQLSPSTSASTRAAVKGTVPGTRSASSASTYPAPSLSCQVLPISGQFSQQQSPLALAKQHLHRDLQATLLLSASTVYLCLSLASRQRQRLFGPGHRVQQSTRQCATTATCLPGQHPHLCFLPLWSWTVTTGLDQPSPSTICSVYVVECKAVWLIGQPVET
jgi:hypothetical protein